jgi:purine-binding chemotaxis protein CheW
MQMAVTTQESTGVTAALAALAGKYLSFKIGEEEYGLPILKVQEIIGMMSVTRVPRVPPFIRGVINLRGKVIPVLDVRKKFNLEQKDDTERTCIIVVRIDHAGERMTMGILVDEVSEVLNIVENQIEAAPTFGEGIHTDFHPGPWQGRHQGRHAAGHRQRSGKWRTRTHKQINRPG